MTDKPKIDNEDAWLLSDGQVWGRTLRGVHKQGTMCKLDLPGEQVLQVVFEHAPHSKINAGQVTQWCDMARGAYHERKAEQAAKKASAIFTRQADSEQTMDAVVGDIETLKGSVFSGVLTRESILQRVGELTTQINAYRAKAESLERERNQLRRVAEVLDAPEDNDTKCDTVSPEKGEGGVPRVVEDARPETDEFVGEAGTTGEDSDISLATLHDSENPTNMDMLFKAAKEVRDIADKKIPTRPEGPNEQD